MVDLREGVKFGVSDYVSVGDVVFLCGETYTVGSVNNYGGKSYIIYNSEGRVGEVSETSLVWWSNFYDYAYKIEPETKNDCGATEKVESMVGMFEVKFKDLRKGDVVNVVWNPSGVIKNVPELYLDQVVEKIHGDIVFSGGGKLGFKEDACTFFLVKRADLPVELGSVVRHEDGWKFVRVEEDLWLGWRGTDSCVFNDSDVCAEHWFEESLGGVEE